MDGRTPRFWVLGKSLGLSGPRKQLYSRPKISLKSFHEHRTTGEYRIEYNGTFAWGKGQEGAQGDGMPLEFQIWNEAQLSVSNEP